MESKIGSVWKKNNGGSSTRIVGLYSEPAAGGFTEMYFCRNIGSKFIFKILVRHLHEWYSQ